MMKKIFTIFLALTMVVGLLAGCGKKNAVEKGESDSNKLSVVTTIFPEYDWVREILGDKAESTDLTMLLNSGVDLHSYQPTADDIVKISDCDLFVYVGGESDGWVESVLKNADNKNVKVINLLNVLGDSAKTEETVEGMQEAEHAHDHSKEVSTFEYHEVQDRSLSDWAGSWQSAYPFALDGTLDDAFAAMAEEGEMTADEYKTYYQNGYKTDITNIDIADDHITFTYENGKKAGTDYKYIGYYIQNWSTGTKAAMYRFEAVDRTSGAPIYIEFNDHMIESAAAEHFHIRMSNESFDAIVSVVKSRLNRVEAYLGVYSLKFLKKSGRISGGAAFVGEALGLKPISHVYDGAVKVCDKVRGEKALVAGMSKKVSARVVQPDKQTAILLYGDVPAERLDEMEKRLRTEIGFRDVERVAIGPSVLTNTGPLAMAVAYYGTPRD